MKVTVTITFDVEIGDDVEDDDLEEAITDAIHDETSMNGVDQYELIHYTPDTPDSVYGRNDYIPDFNIADSAVKDFYSIMFSPQTVELHRPRWRELFTKEFDRVFRTAR